MSDQMGCRLPKLRRSEESPGKIYSTLRRTQVETKMGVAYTYHFLDFLLGKEEVAVSSVLCLSSVRELPVQVCELYKQGFVLAAVHPFVHPCAPANAHLQQQLHRAVLIRETHSSSEKGFLTWAGPRLETDVCYSGHQLPDPDVIQGYVKKVQDSADQGVLFVGFLQQPGGGPCFLGHWDPEELSSLHSSPSPIHRDSPESQEHLNHDLLNHHLQNNDLQNHNLQNHDLQNHNLQNHNLQSLDLQNHNLQNHDLQNHDLQNHNLQTHNFQNPDLLNPDIQNHDCQNHDLQNNDIQNNDLQNNDLQNPDTESTENHDHLNLNHLNLDLLNLDLQNPDLQNHHLQNPDPEIHQSSEDNQSLSQEHQARSESAPSEPEWTHREERPGTPQSRPDPERQQSRDRVHSPQRLGKWTGTTHPQNRVQLFALFNHAGVLSRSPRFYSLKIPLQVHREAGLVSGVDAYWLDHMTQHFRSGASLIDGYFHLGDSNDPSVESVFIFQSESDDAMTPTAYDAIVVEQWTVIDGVAVKTDYIPLLQSLAPYGWRLMCVLPTPIVRTNSDGSLATKQILFLQRPVLPRKRKEFTLLLRGRNKHPSNGETKTTRHTPPPPETDEREAERIERERAEKRNWGNGRSERKSWERRDEGEELSLDMDLPLDTVADDNQEHMGRANKCTNQDSEGGVKHGVQEEEVGEKQRTERALFSGVC